MMARQVARRGITTSLITSLGELEEDGRLNMKLARIMLLLIILAALTFQFLFALFAASAAGTTDRILADPRAIALEIGKAKGDAEVLAVATQISNRARSTSLSCFFRLFRGIFHWAG